MLSIRSDKRRQLRRTSAPLPFHDVIFRCPSSSAFLSLSLRQLQQLQSDQSSSSINLDMASREIEDAVTAYLRRATETFDLSKNVEVKHFGSLILGSFRTFGSIWVSFWKIWATFWFNLGDFWIIWATLCYFGRLFGWLFKSFAQSITICLAQLA